MIMIKIKYNSNTGQILGNYPSNINYPSLTIDKDNKTITDQSGTFPYIEITKEQHEDGMGKNMVVINGNYQEYVKTSAELLQEAKNKKIAELEVFHQSDEVRILTINNAFKVSTNYETSRQYFSELVNKNINKVAALNDLQRLQGEEQTHTTDNVIINWVLNEQSIKVPVTILRIAQYKVGEIVDNNYLQYELHKRVIESLTTKTKVENYDFKKGYLLNNKLNFKI
jgi:nitrate reductase NapAB chaperone NapD